MEHEHWKVSYCTMHSQRSTCQTESTHDYALKAFHSTNAGRELARGTVGYADFNWNTSQQSHAGLPHFPHPNLPLVAEVNSAHQRVFGEEIPCAPVSTFCDVAAGAKEHFGVDYAEAEIGRVLASATGGDSDAPAVSNGSVPNQCGDECSDDGDDGDEDTLIGAAVEADLQEMQMHPIHPTVQRPAPHSQRGGTPKYYKVTHTPEMQQCILEFAAKCPHLPAEGRLDWIFVEYDKWWRLQRRDDKTAPFFAVSRSNIQDFLAKQKKKEGSSDYYASRVGTLHAPQLDALTQPTTTLPQHTFQSQPPPPPPAEVAYTPKPGVNERMLPSTPPANLYLAQLLTHSVHAKGKGVKVCRAQGCKRLIQHHPRVAGQIYCPIKHPDLNEWRQKIASEKEMRKQLKEGKLCKLCKCPYDALHKQPNSSINVYYCPKYYTGRYNDYDDWLQKIGNWLVNAAMSRAFKKPRTA